MNRLIGVGEKLPEFSVPACVSIEKGKEFKTVSNRLVFPAPDSPLTNSGGAGARLPRKREAHSHPKTTAMTEGSLSCSSAAMARGSHGLTSILILESSWASPNAGGMYRILSAPMQNPGPT